MPGQLVWPAVLVAVAVVAVGAFALLRGKTYDWRTLPPKDESDSMAVADAEEYGPLWRYGVPLGYGRVYDAGHDRGYGPS